MLTLEEGSSEPGCNPDLKAGVFYFILSEVEGLFYSNHENIKEVSDNGEEGVQDKEGRYSQSEKVQSEWHGVVALRALGQKKQIIILQNNTWPKLKSILTQAREIVSSL
jgi:hypothetical protein